MCGWSARAGRCRCRDRITNIWRWCIRPGWRPVWCRPCCTTTRRLPSSSWSCSSRISSCARGWLPGLAIRASSTTSRPFWRGRCSCASDLAVPAAQKKEGIAAFAGNHALCKITEDLIFTDPYRRGRAEPLDVALARCDRGRLPRRPRPACRDLPAQAQIHGASGSADPRRPPHRLDHGDGKRDAGDRSRIRVLRTDGVRSSARSSAIS